MGDRRRDTVDTLVAKNIRILRQDRVAAPRGAVKTFSETRQANVLTHDEARRIAANIAKLPELLSRKGEE